MTRTLITRLGAATVALGLLTACGGGSTVDEAVGEGSGETDLAELRGGYVSAMDQIGLPITVERGAFEEHGLDVTLNDPFPTGVDALNALQAGEVDVIQVGTPAIAAAQKGMDLVFMGNYTGSSTQRSIDETMALVATGDSGISGDDLSTLSGKRIGVSVASINHLYLLGLLEEAGLPADAVEIVNTSPPDMGVALETDGLDAGIVWDPWPIQIAGQVEGAEEVLRGGGYIPFVGYQVTTRQWLEENPDVAEDYLTARASVDQWMRENPDDAASAATRWLPGTETSVAEEAMQYNIQQLDPRFSACNILALDTLSTLLAEQDAVESGFQAQEYFSFDAITSVMADNGDLFSDLPEIPEGAAIDDPSAYDREAALEACP